MKKDLKNRSRITSTLDNTLHTEFKKLANETQIPMSKLLDQAVKLLLDSYKTR